MKVARKFTLALIAGILIVHTGSGVVRVQRERALFESDISRDSRVLGRALGHAVQRAWLARGSVEALDIIEHATGRESHVSIRWVWLDAAAGDRRAPVAPAATLEALARGQPVFTRLGSGDGAIYTYVPVDVPGERAGAIEIADALADEHQYLRRSIRNAALTALLIVSLCAMLTWLLGVQLIGRPVARLVDQARAIGRGDLSRRLGAGSNDELGELSVEMDRMCGHLKEARQRLELETRSRIAAIEQLRHADRLKTVGTLASGIAHELGTPINVVEGHAQLIGEDRSASEAARQHVEVILRQCKRMAQIIRQLLDFARRGARQKASSRVGEVARQTLRLLDPLLSKHRVDVRLDGLDADAWVAVAPAELQQVLANVVINGVQAMPDGGRLLLAIERRPGGEPAVAASSDFVALSVEDTGIGMDAATAERVFEPFFTTKEVGVGTGLGLSVAYGIIEDHGGWIEVASQPGRGSRFTIYLPPEPAR